MATIKLIAGKINSKRHSVVYVQYVHDQKRAIFSTGIKLDKKLHWEDKIGRVKNSHPEAIQINQLLHQKISEINTLVLQCRHQNIEPTIERIRSLKDNKHQKQKETPFFPSLNEYLEVYSDNKSKSTISIYNNVKSYLKSFETDSQQKIEWDNINYDFLERFSLHLFRNMLSSSTVRRNISYFKSFLSHAFKKGSIKSKEYEEFTIKVPKKDVLSLTEIELEKFKKIKLPVHLDKIRQSFVFSCMTGIRFSDLVNVKKEAVEITKSGAVLRLTVQKTRSLTTIPLIFEALDILKRRDYSLVTVSHQRYLILIKRIAKLAGINKLVRVISYKGSEKTERIVEKHLCIGSHTARRTYISLSLDKGVPIQFIASITHGGNVNSLLKYISIDEERKLEVLNKAWAKKK